MTLPDDGVIPGSLRRKALTKTGDVTNIELRHHRVAESRVAVGAASWNAVRLLNRIA